MKNTFEELRNISYLESVCKNPETVNAITESLEDKDDAFGVFNTADEALNALFKAIEEEELDETNSR